MADTDSGSSRIVEFATLPSGGPAWVGKRFKEIFRGRRIETFILTLSVSNAPGNVHLELVRRLLNSDKVLRAPLQEELRQTVSDGHWFQAILLLDDGHYFKLDRFGGEHPRGMICSPGYAGCAVFEDKDL